MARLSRIAIHPIKSLDQHVRDRVTITEHGGLEGDREYAMVDDDGEFVNGKRTAAVHGLEASVDPAGSVTFGGRGDRSSRTFDLSGDNAAINDFLTDYFEFPVRLRRTDGPAMTDIGDPGPTVIAQATLDTVADWFPGIDAAEMTRRLRPNLVVHGVEPFWADRVAMGTAIRIGDVRLEGVKPVPRCVVPTRQPETGETYDGFRETFIRNRKATFPDWADESAFPGYFALMAATHAPAEARGQSISVGARVSLIDENG